MGCYARHSKPASGATVASSADYLLQEKLKDKGYKPSAASRKTASYFDAAFDGGVAFDEVHGSLVKDFGLELGITMRTYSEFFDGQFDGHTPDMGYEYLYEPDPNNPGQNRKIIDPETGKAKNVPYRVPYHALFVAPDKSWSVALIAIERENPELAAELVNDWKAAVAVGIDALERNIHMAQVNVPLPIPAGGWQKGERRTAPQSVTAKFLAVCATQRTARPTDASLSRPDPVSDPHLHTHINLMNQVMVDGRWLSIRSKAIHGEEAMELLASTVHTEAARRWEERGVSFDHIANRYGRYDSIVRGVNPDAVRRYSSNEDRTDAIAEAFERREGRPPTKTELATAMSASRKGKAHDDQDTRPDNSRWLRDLEQAGLDAGDVKIKPSPERDSRNEREAVLRERLYGDNGLCRSDANFYGKSIESAVVRKAVGLGFSPEELRAFELELRNELVVTRPADTDRDTLYTTLPNLLRERSVEADLAKRAEQRPITRQNDRVVIADTDELDTSQKALKSAVVSGQRLVFGCGEAGTGKTRSMRAAGRDIRLLNPDAQILLVAVAAHTAKESAEKIEADKWATIEKLRALMEPDSFPDGRSTLQKTTDAVKGRGGKREPLAIDDNTVVVVDEAAMMDTYRMAELVRLMDGKGQLVLLGDSSQLTPIGASGWWADATEKHPRSIVELKEVYRHKGPAGDRHSPEAQADLRAYRLIRNGQAKEALDDLSDRGRIHISEDASHRVADLTGFYKELRDNGRDADEVQVLTDTSNKYVDQINRFIQNDRRERGEVSANGFAVMDEEQHRSWTLAGGDRVIFVSKYDRGKTWVSNGESGVLERVQSNGTAWVTIGEGDKARTLKVKLDAVARQQPIALAYCIHNNKYQGQEAPIILNLPGLGQTNQNSGYTGSSRSVEESHHFVDYETHGGANRDADPVDLLAAAWSRPAESPSALRMMSNQNPQEARDRQATDTMHRPETNSSRSDGAVARGQASAHRERGEELANHIARRFGESIAATIAGSPAFPTLVARVHDELVAGQDGYAKLDAAIAERELGTADDAAAVLTWRMDRARLDIPQKVDSVSTAVVHVPRPAEEPVDQQVTAPTPEPQEKQQAHSERSSRRLSWREMWDFVKNGGISAGEKPQKADARWGDKIDQVLNEIERETAGPRPNEGSRRVAETIIAHKAAQAAAAWRAEARPHPGPVAEPAKSVAAAPEQVVETEPADWEPSDQQGEVVDAELVEDEYTPPTSYSVDAYIAARMPDVHVPHFEPPVDVDVEQLDKQTQAWTLEAALRAYGKDRAGAVDALLDRDAHETPQVKPQRDRDRDLGFDR